MDKNGLVGIERKIIYLPTKAISIILYSYEEKTTIINLGANNTYLYECEA